MMRNKDHSRSVIQSYVEKNNCIHYVYKENGGVSSARNLGLELIDSEYVTLIDGDDWVSDDYFTVILNELKKDPELLCFNYFIASDTKSVQKCMGRQRRGKFKSWGWYEWLFTVSIPKRLDLLFGIKYID